MDFSGALGGFLKYLMDNEGNVTPQLETLLLELRAHAFTTGTYYEVEAVKAYNRLRGFWRNNPSLRSHFTKEVMEEIKRIRQVLKVRLAEKPHMPWNIPAELDSTEMEVDRACNSGNLHVLHTTRKTLEQLLEALRKQEALDYIQGRLYPLIDRLDTVIFRTTAALIRNLFL